MTGADDEAADDGDKKQPRSNAARMKLSVLDDAECC